MNEEERNILSNKIIGAAIEVHKTIGPGVLESTYRMALVRELEILGIASAEEVDINFTYKGKTMENVYRADILVENEIVVELKASEQDNPLYCRQLLTYLRLMDKRLGLLINFNRCFLKDGIKRIAN